MHSRWFDGIGLSILILGSSAACLDAGSRLGATFDEPAYIATGLESWRTGSNKQLMTWGAMPLPIDVQTLPVYLWELHNGIPFQPYRDLAVLLPVAWAANLPFWWLLLIYGWRWGNVLGGPWAGRLAAGFFATDPNLLVHASLATTDIASTAMVLVTVFHFTVARQRNWCFRVGLPGILFGLALSTKASALPYVPLLCGLFGIIELRKIQPDITIRKLWKITDQLRWDLFVMGLVAIPVVFAYCGSDWSAEPTFVAWVQQLPEGPLHKALLPVSERLAIFPNAGEGLVQQVKHNFRGHGGVNVLGTWHEKPVWYYFPAVLSAKVPDSTLMLLAGLLVFRRRGLLNAAFAAALLLLLFSLNTRVQIGVRLVFPLIAFLHIGLAVGWMKSSDSRVESCEFPRMILPILALLWALFLARENHPDGLRYRNSVWMAKGHARELLTDSNYDWGQGLPELREWWSANGEPELHVWYYGADPAVLLPPFRHLPVQHLPNPGMETVRERVGHGYLAVSDSLLSGCPDRRAEVLAVLEELKPLEPVARTGTFAIYRLDR